MTSRSVAVSDWISNVSWESISASVVLSSGFPSAIRSAASFRLIVLPARIRRRRITYDEAALCATR